MPPRPRRPYRLFKACDAERAAQAQRADALAAQLEELQLRPPVPPAARRTIALFEALTAMAVAPRDAAAAEEAAGGAGAGPVLGAFDLETTDPDSGEAVRFALEFMLAPAPAPFSPSTAAAGGPSAAPAYPTGVVVEFSPGEGCAELLPPFLHQPISFGSEQAPMFLAKVTEALRHANYAGAGEDVAEGEEGAEDAGAEAGSSSSSSSAAAGSGSPTVVLGGPRGASEADMADASGSAPTPPAASVAASSSSSSAASGGGGGGPP